MNEADLETEKPTRQYLTFVLAGEHYAVDSLGVREILEYTRLTRVPGMPVTVRGAINLRGSVVPVIDLQARFGGSRTELNKRTCIIILDVPDEDSRQPLGVLADAVSAVREIERTEIQQTPAFGSHLRDEFVTGVVRMGERFIRLLALDQVLDLEALGKPATRHGG